MDLIIFYGIVSLLPLFFLYLIYRDIAGKNARRNQLTQYFKSPDPEILEEAKGLIGDLDSIFPWARPSTITTLVKQGSRGVEIVSTALDLPYYVSWLRGYVVTQDDFRDIFINFAVNIHFLLIDALAGIGRLSPENLMAALRHQNLNVRMAALAALGKTGHPAAVELLVPFLDSNDLEERISAIVALGELRNKAVTDKVITSLKDENPVVRERAIRALMQINDTEALPALEDLARTDDTVIDDRPIITMKNLAEEAITIIRKNNPVTAKRISR